MSIFANFETISKLNVVEISNGNQKNQNNNNSKNKQKLTTDKDRKACLKSEYSFLHWFSANTFVKSSMDHKQSSPQLNKK